MADMTSLDQMNASGNSNADLLSIQMQATQYLGLIYQALLNGPQRWSNVPATATSDGVAGDMAYSTTHLYICVSANLWRRVAVSAF